MAGGWTRDGAIQTQIDDTVSDAIANAGVWLAVKLFGIVLIAGRRFLSLAVRQCRVSPGASIVKASAKPTAKFNPIGTPARRATPRRRNVRLTLWPASEPRESQ